MLLTERALPRYTETSISNGCRKNLCDGFQELRHEIDQCHLAYLDMEESSEKLDLRIKLEGK